MSVPQVARVLSEVYGDRMASNGGEEGESFPLQQKLLVCCLLLLTRSGKSREIQLGKVSVYLLVSRSFTATDPSLKVFLSSVHQGLVMNSIEKAQRIGILIDFTL